MVDDVEMAVIIRTDNPSRKKKRKIKFNDLAFGIENVLSFVVKVMKEGNSILMLNVITAMVMLVAYVHRTVAFFVHV